MEQVRINPALLQQSTQSFGGLSAVTGQMAKQAQFDRIQRIKRMAEERAAKRDLEVRNQAQQNWQKQYQLQQQQHNLAAQKHRENLQLKRDVQILREQNTRLELERNEAKREFDEFMQMEKMDKLGQQFDKTHGLREEEFKFRKGKYRSQWMMDRVKEKEGYAQKETDRAMQFGRTMAGAPGGLTTGYEIMKKQLPPSATQGVPAPVDVRAQSMQTRADAAMQKANAPKPPSSVYRYVQSLAQKLIDSESPLKIGQVSEAEIARVRSELQNWLPKLSPEERAMIPPALMSKISGDEAMSVEAAEDQEERRWKELSKKYGRN